MFSEETRSIFAVLSLGLGIFGFFMFALFVGPPAIILGILAFYKSEKAPSIETIFKNFAIIGIGLGLLEVIFVLLTLIGVIPTTI
ncbi:MAG: hypothetical protein ACTSYB_10445 [Candidatus Helarchaeota archaeon]